MLAIQLPLDIYDHFVGCCDPENSVTSFLKSGTIVRRPNGERIAEISCQPDEAKTLLATATKVSCVLINALVQAEPTLNRLSNCKLSAEANDHASRFHTIKTIKPSPANPTSTPKASIPRFQARTRGMLFLMTSKGTSSSMPHRAIR